MSEWFPASDDPNLMGRFVDRPIVDQRKSEEKGENVYKMVAMLELRPKGHKDIAAHRLKPHNSEELIRRFPDSWKSYQGEQVEMTGTPLTDLPGLSPERAAGWSIVGIRTVEDLATANDAVLNNLGFGARDHQKKAKNMLAAQEREQGEAEPKPKRRPGRPRKAETENA